MNAQRFINLVKTIAIDAIESSKPMKYMIGVVSKGGTTDLEIKIADNQGNYIVLTQDELILTDAVVNHQTWLSFDDKEIKQNVTVREGMLKAKDGSVKGALNAASATHQGATITISGALSSNEVNLTLKDVGAQLNMPDDPKDTYKIEGYLRFTEKVKHKVTIYNELKEGDQVVLLRITGGQKYIVLSRFREPNEAGRYKDGVFNLGS